MAKQFEKLVIFELANNHQGDLSHADYIVRKLAEKSAGYNFNFAVKLQYRNLDTFIHPKYVDRNDVKHIPRFLSTRLNKDEFRQIVDKIKSVGLITMCTPFDEESVELCDKHGIEIIKVASCSSNDWPLLEKVASLGKPIIVSTGGKTLEQ